MRNMVSMPEREFDRPGRKPTYDTGGGNGEFIALMMKGVIVLAALCFVVYLMIRPTPQIELGKTEFKMPGLAGSNLPGIDSASLKGQAVVVNVWATWCGPCRMEHPELIQAARQRGLRIHGLLVDDTEANGTAFLKENGNPFVAASLDKVGLRRTLAVRGYPTTMVIDPNGKVVWRWAGNLNMSIVDSQLIPALNKARLVPVQPPKA